MIDIASISKHLYLSKNGIWVTGNINDISYASEMRQDKFEIEDKSFWFKHRNQCIYQAIRNYDLSDLFFDIGGGNGYVTSVIQQMGIETVLVEPGVEGVHNARKRGIHHLVNSTMEDAGFLPKTMPAIGLFDVLEHIEDDESFLKQVHNCLTDTGILFLTVPSYNTLWSVSDIIDGHFRRYNRKSLQRLFHKSGFKLDYYTYFFSFLVLPIYLLRSLPSQIKIRKTKNIEAIKSEDTISPEVQRIIKPFLNWELYQIQRSSVIPFGTSCLCLATKS